MTRTYQFGIALLATFILIGCNGKNNSTTVTISNNLSVVRNSETVEISISDLNISLSAFENLEVIEQESGNVILSQLIDSDGDGLVDMLLFQPVVKANSEAKYSISPSNDSVIAESKVFSRLAPERTDDYAWENDKVAFRTFGPTAQKMKEEGIITKPIYGTEGGTLSSGMDCWLKKVDYPIINNWYKKHTTGEGSYHKDTGEGLDNFHVGSSRGCGGLGVYLNDELYTSKNFTAYSTIANGPIRTEFILDYADWNADDLTISEQKRISLDLGSNFMNVNAKIEGAETITVGLTLHENDGEASVDTVNGWFSYWQPHADSELGTAIVIDPKYYLGHTKVESEVKDKSQLLVHLKVIKGYVEYKAGFCWKESNQFKNKAEWENYLNKYSKLEKSPLELMLN